MHPGDGAGLWGPCRYGCFVKHNTSLSFTGFVGDYVPNLRAHTSILSPIMGVGARSAFDRRTFSRDDLDVRNPILVGRTEPLERQGLPTSGCWHRLL